MDDEIDIRRNDVGQVILAEVKFYCPVVDLLGPAVRRNVKSGDSVPLIE
jgi:hypothetical protein